MKEDPGQVNVAVADNWELPLLSSCPAFTLCSVCTAANLFNLNGEADEFMRMERCWMMPPGHYWCNHHTLWIQGHQIDSLDGHCCMSRCVHCDWVCFCGAFVQFYVHPYCNMDSRNVYLATFVCYLLLNLLVRGFVLCVCGLCPLQPNHSGRNHCCSFCCGFQIWFKFKWTSDSNLVKQDPNKCLLIEF